ncbi:unnamed protein product [Cuscuta epithymum]|uniref:Uncharacterized protein n=1 Tax=Cuscuta epithymum TaxID=186058 RepID=A0AAV0DKH8_9ASTE|nr:unnamed protein product [Cuscuta epithymum]
MEKVKRQGGEMEDDDGGTVKRRKTETVHDGVIDDAYDGGDMMEWLTLDDDAMLELSKLLDPEDPPESFKVRFSDDPYLYSPPVISRSTAYVTINGNEESCGSSFSDLDSSVMASVDIGGSGGVVGGWAKEFGCAWGSDAFGARGWLADADVSETERLVVKDMEDRDGSWLWVNDADQSNDDSVLANFLGEM